MSSYPTSPSSGSDDLQVQALLYASGLLDDRESARFEKRLADDQHACEALADATSQLLSTGRSPKVKPSGDYREQVRKRLRPERKIVGVVTKRKRVRGDPVMWVLIGAVTVVLLVVGVTYWMSPGTGPSQPVSQAPVGSPTRLKSLHIPTPFDINANAGENAAPNSDGRGQGPQNGKSPYPPVIRLVN